MHFARSIPNVAAINFSYNALKDLTALSGLEYLRRLMVVGNNLKSFVGVFKVVKGLRKLELLDLR